MDDNKVSYVEQEVIDDVIRKVEESFPVLTVTKGNVHTLLGVKIRYLDNRRIAINMKENITEAVKEFGEDVSKVVMLPTVNWVFIVVKDRELQGKRLDTFHSFFMKLLCIL